MPSTYAKAVKHIALRGRTALGPSVKELELQLYRKSFLPADYRPPKTEKWDDMIERWAYAWQYPLEDDTCGESRNVVKNCKSGLRRLADFCSEIQNDPPYVLGKDKISVYPLLPSSDSTKNVKNCDQNEESKDVTHGNSTPASSNKLSAQFTTNASLLPSEPLAEDGMPVAYLDFNAPITARSKELAVLMANDLGLSYDPEGIKSAIRALGIYGNYKAAATLFDLAKALGLGGQNIISYNAIIAMYANQGLVNECMSLVEEAKSKGVTPDRVTWTILIHGFVQAHDCSSAIQVYDHMRELANLEPDEATFAAVLWAHARDITKESSVMKCVELFEHMQSAYNMMPLRQCFDAVLYALQRQPKDHALLVEYGRKMEILGFEWSNQTFFYMMCGSANRGDLSALRKLFAKLQENGHKFQVQHLLTVLTAYSHAIRKAEYENFKAENAHPKNGLWKEAETTCLGVLALIHTRSKGADKLVKAGDETTSDLAVAMKLKSKDSFTSHWISRALSSLLHIYASIIHMIGEHYAHDLTLFQEWSNKGMRIWTHSFNDYNITEKPAQAYVAYLKFLSLCKGEVARAESVFAELALSGGVGQKKILPKSAYVNMILLHLRSGEEGSTTRALSYLDAMEKVGYPSTVALLRRIRNISEEAAYTRDMRRRSRRMEQAREEYEERHGSGTAEHEIPLDHQNESSLNAQKEKSSSDIHPSFRGLRDVEQTNFRGDYRTQGTPDGVDPDVVYDPTNPLLHCKDDLRRPLGSSTEQSNKELRKFDAEQNLPSLDPVPPMDTPIEYWEKWKSNTLTKHKLFDSPSDDGTPRGESFEEKNQALAKLGIISKFKKPEDIPNPRDRNKLLPILRADGSEPAGALWAIDESGYVYPEKRLGAFGWDTTLWRERNLLKKYAALAVSRGETSLLQSTPFAPVGMTKRTIPEQIEIDSTNAKTPSELADAKAFPHEVYEDGSRKPVAEHSTSLPHAGELVWVKDRTNPLAPYMDDEDMENAMQSADTLVSSENNRSDAVTTDSPQPMSPVMYAAQKELYTESVLAKQIAKEESSQSRDVIETLRTHKTETLAFASRHGIGARSVAGHKNRKYDYLQRFKEMYQRGQLEVPEEPLLRFGRSASDMTHTTAASIQAFYDAQKRTGSTSDTERASYRPVTEERVRRLRAVQDQKQRRRMGKSENFRKHQTKTRQNVAPKQYLPPDHSI